MNLNNTKTFMEELKNDNFFDAYAVLVCKDNDKQALFSDNVNGDTYFDIASMGKILITQTLILKAIGEKKLSLDDTLGKFFANVPEDRAGITVKQILTHTSGIVRCDLPDEVTEQGNDAIADYIIKYPLAYETGTNRIYSCNAFILLGFIIEKIYNMPLDEAFYKYTKNTMGLTRSRFNIAIDEENAAVCYGRREVCKCRVDDSNVYKMNGVAGSGAQFWTLNDMEKFTEAIMAKDEALYPKELYALAEQNITGALELGGEVNGLGWLFVDENYEQTGKLFPVGSLGHCGHTGTSFFLSREKNMYVIILTNATRFGWRRCDFKTDDYPAIMKMREDIHNKILEDLENK